jgi:hypothetical protein
MIAVKNMSEIESLEKIDFLKMHAECIQLVVSLHEQKVLITDANEIKKHDKLIEIAEEELNIYDTIVKNRSNPKKKTVKKIAKK